MDDKDGLLTVVADCDGLEVLGPSRSCENCSLKSTSRADTSGWRTQASSGVKTRSSGRADERDGSMLVG